MPDKKSDTTESLKKFLSQSELRRQQAQFALEKHKNWAQEKASDLAEKIKKITGIDWEVNGEIGNRVLESGVFFKHDKTKLELISDSLIQAGIYSQACVHAYTDPKSNPFYILKLKPELIDIVYLEKSFNSNAENEPMNKARQYKGF